jgi:hypothetical protein
MHDAIADGFIRHDMERLEPTNVGLARYKLKWGTNSQTERLIALSRP